MLFTLIAIAVTSLAVAPAVLPRVKRFIGQDDESELKQQKNDIDDLSTESSSIVESIVNTDGLEDISLEEPEDNHPVSNPYRFSKSVNTVSQNVSQSKDIVLGANSMVEIIWSANEKPTRPKIHIDHVEKFRQTPSADLLFSEDSSIHVLESVNPNESPRLIAPKMNVPPPKAAQQLTDKVSNLTFRDSDTIKRGSKSIKHSPKVRLNPIPLKEKKSSKSALSLKLTSTPLGKVQNKGFEVIKPEQKKVKHHFSLFESPEEMAWGEQAWRSVQPLYIDFSPFFSLDTLINIKDGPLRTSPISFKKYTQNPTQISNLGGKRQQHQAQQYHHNDLINSKRTTPAPMKQVSMNHDDFVDDRWDEDDLDETYHQDQQRHAATQIPEWYSLLSLSSHFLFDLKLSQQTEQNEELENSILHPEPLGFKLDHQLKHIEEEPEVRHREKSKEYKI